MTPEHRIETFRADYDSASACAARFLCDIHPADRIAFTIVDSYLSGRDVTYGELADQSRRFAAALTDLGVGPGDRVATLMGKSLELVVALLGIWRCGAVHVPLFTAFAESTAVARVRTCGAKVIVCDMAQRPKLASVTASRVIVAAEVNEYERPHGSDLIFAELQRSYRPEDATTFVGGGDAVLVQLYTSGTTGLPKGVPLPIKALAAIRTYVEYGLDVHRDDVYWNAADTGWGYGLFYGLLGPLTAGMSNLLLRSSFSPELTWRVMSRYQVTNFAAAPTVFRALRGCPSPSGERLALRRLSSAGEPLTADVVEWSRKTFGVEVRDHYGQTEHGMVIVNGWHPDVRGPLKPGSMGQPMPGWTTSVLWPDRDEIAPPGTPGRIAIDVPGSPLFWFPGYVDAPEATAERFSEDGRWYYTGDVGCLDDDGYCFFSARDDDVIIMAGYRIGPFEVESALTTHPDVSEAVVVGVPDNLRGEVVEAFVVPRPGVAPSDALAADLKLLVKQTYAAHAYPRKVHFLPELPKGPSGKIQRSLLRTRRREQLAGSGGA
ncbi:AMP-binding protein [Fodinicola acaciae]|uniref:AMP-binding protein n=1 Tax=Fodinicola acaciae TaxID=2681555 RepID=UPI0013D4990D|nr:AMP-binding protein [Fodinicola acaciae]